MEPVLGRGAHATERKSADRHRRSALSSSALDGRQQQQLPQQVLLALQPQLHSGQSQQQVSVVSVCMDTSSLVDGIARQMALAALSGL